LHFIIGADTERTERQYQQTGTRRRQTWYDPGPMAGFLVSDQQTVQPTAQHPDVI
jgi:hypothetical protein